MQRAELISHRLKLQQMKTLLAVAKYGSMAKAAKQFSMSQSVVSKTIADLEDTLGVRLFDRNTQGIEPTIYGQAFLKRCTAIFGDLRASVDEIEFLADPGSGELRIGSTEPQAGGLVATIIKRLYREYPRIDFRIEIADMETLVGRDLPERRIDLAIGLLPTPSLDENLEATVLFYDRLCVVVDRQSRWARRRKVSLAELASEPWCASPIESALVSRLISAFRAGGLEGPRISVATTSSQLNNSLLANGRFLWACSEAFLYFNAKRLSLKMLPIQLPAEPFTVAVVTLKNRTISPVARLFIDCAYEVVKPLTDGRTGLAGR
jgi:DNA-binding transcriptional LysR family regulator